ncbi:Elicitor-responsive-like protein [Melia azedarach]|uniref:Elicitor-responsive-like protein n=1 Tax=Melia azedarach TaxID=155640 RepID=A0ACC1YYI4_MELAZ|nr:Elicitor-responsive-like protein [Melia azedarach]
MKGGILEVLVVNAEGIRHTNIFGTPAYYVIAQCGTQEYRTKVSSVKDEKTWWNEKFRFEFTLSDWKHLTHIKFRIMDTEFFTDAGFVGETIYHLGGIITEGNERGLIEVKPAPCNVVLEDNSYKGQIMIGFKFIVNDEVHEEGRKFLAQENAPRQSICRSIINLWKTSWFRFLFYSTKVNSKNESKET